MTILFFSRLFYPHIGGVETHVLEISRRLVNNGYKVSIVTERFNKSLKTRENYEGTEIYRIDAGKDDWFKKFRLWWQLFKIRSLIGKADIVHCHDVFFWYLPFRFLLFWKKVYITFHGYEGKFPPSRKSILVRKISEKLSDGNICVGEYIKKWYGTKPNSVTYGATEISNIKFQISNKTQNSNLKNQKHSSKLRILFVGRLDKDNGVELYLDAVGKLKDQGKDVEFEACGDGELKIEAQRLGKVHGFVKNLKPYIEKADLVFASSYLSILEAFAHKKLVFAVYDNPLKEDYFKMALFSEYMAICSSSEELVGEISKSVVVSSKNAEYKVKSAYEWINMNTWDNVLGQYLKLWNFKDKTALRSHSQFEEFSERKRPLRTPHTLRPRDTGRQKATSSIEFSHGKAPRA